MAKNPFTHARKSRGWTFTQASNRMRNVSEQQLRNLEGISATRDTDPGNIRVSTALEILRVYWPDIDAADFVKDTVFSVRPRDPLSLKKLKGYLE